MSSTKKNNAEQLFRKAFERLKNNKPKVLPRDTPVSQNNVAKEAGRDPSALKKDRYPILVLEIQAYIATVRELAATGKKDSNRRTRSTKKALSDCQKQRDKLETHVKALNTYIEELLDEIERQKAGKITRIK